MTPHLLALMELFNQLNSKRPDFYRLEILFNGSLWDVTIWETDAVGEDLRIAAFDCATSMEEACERALLSHATIKAQGRLSMEDAEKLVAVANRITQESSLTPQKP